MAIKWPLNPMKNPFHPFFGWEVPEASTLRSWDDWSDWWGNGSHGSHASHGMQPGTERKFRGNGGD